ncbi:MAG: DUF6777 domain-containing protein [Acidimicrobiales bacterium]
MAASRPAPLSQPKRSGKRRAILGVVAVVAVVAGGLVAYSVFGGDSASASVVSLEALGTPGPDPFTAPVAPKPSTTLAAFAEKGGPAAAQPELAAAGKSRYRTAQGGVVGIYGGTLDEAACDGSQLVSFLEAEPEKASSWASVVEIEPTDISPYVAGLTPANLAVDTRVINFSFANGASVPRPAVLQRGNAVMVDTRGVPRVNCYSGNPLKEPTAVAEEESFTGSRWPAFDAGAVVVIQPAPEPVEEFKLVDIETGETFTRPAGEGGATPASTTSTAPKDDAATGNVAPAGPIKAGEPYNGQVSPATPEVRYTIDVPDGAVITLRIANDRASKAGVYAELTASGERLEALRVNPNAEEEREYVRTSEDGGPYELKFTEGPASFEFEVGIKVQDDGGQAKDAGDDAAGALDVAAGTKVSGRLGGQDQMDRYTIKLQAGTELRLTSQTDRSATAGINFRVEISGSNIYSERIGPGGTDEFSALLGPKDAGILDVLVSEGPGQYSFTLELVPQRDGGQAGDAGNTLAEARALSSLSDLSGTIGGRDDFDYYVLTASAAELQLNVTTAATSTGAPNFRVQGPDGGALASGRVAAGATDSFPFKAVPGQQYRIVVSEGPASYVFSVSG